MAVQLLDNILYPSFNFYSVTSVSSPPFEPIFSPSPAFLAKVDDRFVEAGRSLKGRLLRFTESRLCFFKRRVIGPNFQGTLTSYLPGINPSVAPEVVGKAVSGRVNTQSSVSKIGVAGTGLAHEEFCIITAWIDPF
jgi:hypothetical protein